MFKPLIASHDATRRCCWAPPTMRPIIERLLPGASHRHAAAAVAAGILRRPQAHPAAAAHRDRRVLGRRGLRHRRIDHAPARRRRGGAGLAVSPRTRNAQVEMFQSGDVDYLVATDAVGMGLNLDVDHVAFASDRKYDGYQFRRLNPSEFAQIAGRAGRATRDGTFGTTARCAPFEPELVNALQNHTFESVKVLQWRNSKLDFSSLGSAAGVAGADAEPRGADPGADRRRPARARSRRARRRGARHGAGRRRRRAAVGRLPDSGLPQDRAGRPCRTGDHAVRLPDEEGPDPGRLVRRPGRAGRPHNRRYRHIIGPDRADPDLDLRGQSAGLAGRSRTLAGNRARSRK